MLHISLYEDVLETNFSWKESLDAVILLFFFFPQPQAWRYDAYRQATQIYQM